MELNPTQGSKKADLGKLSCFSLGLPSLASSPLSLSVTSLPCLLPSLPLSYLTPLPPPISPSQLPHSLASSHLSPSQLPPTTAKDNQFVTQNLTPQEIAQPCKVQMYLLSVINTLFLCMINKIYLSFVFCVSVHKVFPRVRETRVEQAMQQLMTGHHNGEMENEEEAEEMR